MGEGVKELRPLTRGGVWFAKVTGDLFAAASDWCGEDRSLAAASTAIIEGQ